MKHITLCLLIVLGVGFYMSRYDRLHAQTGGICTGGVCYTISDQVWVDDGDGIQELDDNNPELPLSGAKVELFLAGAGGNPASNQPIASYTTQSDGKYEFDVSVGIYMLRFSHANSIYTHTLASQTVDSLDSDADPITGFTGPITVTGSIPQATLWDAGFVDLENCGWNNIGDTLWHDKDDNGIYPTGQDEPLPGIRVDLFREEPALNGLIIPTGEYDITDSYGRYDFRCLDENKRYSVLVRDSSIMPDFLASPHATPDVHPATNNDSNFLRYHPDEASIRDENQKHFFPLASTNHIDLETPPAVNNTVDGGFVCGDEADVIFVMDASGSVSVEQGSEIEEVKSIINVFLDQMDSNKHRVAAVEFRGTGFEIADLTFDYASVRSAVNGQIGEKSTNIGAGIGEASAEFGQHLRSTAVPVIVVLSDGEQGSTYDEATLATLRAVKAAYKNLIVVTVSIGEYAQGHVLLRMASSRELAFENGISSSEISSLMSDVFNNLCNRLPSDYEEGGCPVATYYDISTGWNQAGLHEIEPGATDDDWIVRPKSETTPEASGPAEVVEPHERWRLLDGAGWISHDEERESYGWDKYIYTYEFDVDGDPTEILLDLRAYADDTIDTVKVGLKSETLTTLSSQMAGVEMSGSGQFLSLAPMRIVAEEPSLFGDGLNVIEVTVKDPYKYNSGLLVDGVVRLCTTGGDGGGQSGITATPSTTPTPSSTPTPSNTPTPTMTPTPTNTPCALGQTELGQNIGGTTGETYWCLEEQVRMCRTTSTRLLESDLESGGYKAFEWAPDLKDKPLTGTCSKCGSCIGVTFCDESVMDVSAISPNVGGKYPSYHSGVFGSEAGKQIEIISDLDPKIDIRRHGDTSFRNNSVGESAWTVERQVYWAYVGNELVLFQPIESNFNPNGRVWVRPMGNPSYECTNSWHPPGPEDPTPAIPCEDYCDLVPTPIP